MDDLLNTVYIGAEGLTTPLGLSSKETWDNILSSKSGLSKINRYGFEKEDLILGKFSESQLTHLSKNKASNKLLNFIFNSITESLSKINLSELDQNETVIIFSTTKATISSIGNEYPDFKSIENEIKAKLDFKSNFITVSNACISGVSALIVAHDLIKVGKYKNAIVIGADEVSSFTTYGFQSFFALSDAVCKPFDKERKGINLGEGAAVVIVSANPSLYKFEKSTILGGAVANDANHISGPSRTGEGLFRSIKKAEKQAEINAEKVDFVSAHGTSTNYNDEMESIAFSRAGYQNTPLNSLKAYFGHTLGAAGLIEFIISNISLHENTLVKSLNFEEQGTSKELNIITDFQKKDLQLFLKTASGFGGCNASILISK